MNSLVGVVMTALMLTVSFLSGAAPCAPGNSPGVTVAPMAAHGSHANMADMDGKSDGRQQCAMPLMISCCQSLVSRFTGIANQIEVPANGTDPFARAKTLMSRSIAPDTPPPKA